MPKNAAAPEDFVKSKLRRLLPEHFLFAEEVRGRGPFQNVRADFWCSPKPHLVEAGWVPEPFAIEAKGFQLDDHRKRTAVHVIQQAIIYSMALFPTRQGDKRPNWVLIHPPLSALLDADSAQRPQTFGGGLMYGLARVGALFNVGEFDINDDGFEVMFHGGTYYSSKRGFNGANQLARGRDVASR